MALTTRLLTTGLFACVGLACAAEPIPLDESAHAVVNGEPDMADPAVVLVQGKGFICTGSLIADKLILTARHCVLDTAQGEHRIHFGHGWSGGFTTVLTTGYDFYPGNNDDLSTDIAVIHMAESAPDGIQPLPINSISLDDRRGAPLRIVGFGITSSQSSDSGRKRVGTSSITRLESRLVFHTLQPAASCSGDSGGPQFITIDGTEFIAGITSYGTGNCSFGEHGAVRPDAFLEWLNQFYDTRFDKVDPTLSITSPADGDRVAPGFVVLADAQDDLKLDRVEMAIAGEVVSSDFKAPYELVAPPNTPLGAHTLTITAFDQYRNKASQTFTVTIERECDTDADCDDGETCSDVGACALALGSDCSASHECASSQCFIEPGQNAGLCTLSCESNAQCPSGFACEQIGTTSLKKCFAQGGGCGVAPGRASARTNSFLFLALGLTLLLGRRAHLRARRQALRR